MKKITANIGLALLIMSMSVTLAGAQVQMETRERVKVLTPEGIEQDLQEAKEIREEFRMREEERQEIFRERLQSEASQGELMMMREGELRDLVIERREAAREIFQERLEQARNKWQKERANLREELRNKVGDWSKRMVVERVDQQLEFLNEKFVTQFTGYLDRLEELLGRLQARADKATAAGLDTIAFDAMSLEAKEAIAAGRAAVEEQVAKVYVIQVENEEDLRNDMAVLRQELQDDLREVRAKMMAAKQAVVVALQALRTLPRVDEVGEE